MTASTAGSRPTMTPRPVPASAAPRALGRIPVGLAARQRASWIAAA